MERYRITSDAAVYYITYSIVDWLPVFTSEAAFRIIADSFNYCHKEKGLRINAFVIMPTHLHAIVFSVNFRSEPLAAALTDFRKFTGRRLSDYCREFMPPCFHQTLQACSGKDRERRFWQPSRHPVAVQTERFWRQKLDYLHENPVRKGLVRRSREWRHSSALWYDTDAQQPCDVHLTGINWSRIFLAMRGSPDPALFLLCVGLLTLHVARPLLCVGLLTPHVARPQVSRFRSACDVLETVPVEGSGSVGDRPQHQNAVARSGDQPQQGNEVG